jgi:hypothetical protein
MGWAFAEAGAELALSGFHCSANLCPVAKLSLTHEVTYAGDLFGDCGHDRIPRVVIVEDGGGVDSFQARPFAKMGAAPLGGGNWLRPAWRPCRRPRKGHSDSALRQRWSNPSAIIPVALLNAALQALKALDCNAERIEYPFLCPLIRCSPDGRPSRSLPCLLLCSHPSPIPR